ncbi:MAG: SoxY-related AACIE arm protein [Haliea sp.]|nr:MAG: SoxY-related AACIE arm protein [Haliea sp.]
MPATPTSQPNRRDLIAAGAGLVGTLLVMPARAQTEPHSSDTLTTALLGFTAGAATREGRVLLDIAPLVDNGNTVPVTVTVDSPMTAADHVTAIAVFNERNPQREVIKARLSPLSGKAQLSTRIRLATTQKLVAVARMSDGSFWTHTVDVIVTLAACIEE